MDAAIVVSIVSGFVFLILSISAWKGKKYGEGVKLEPARDPAVGKRKLFQYTPDPHPVLFFLKKLFIFIMYTLSKRKEESKSNKQLDGLFELDQPGQNKDSIDSYFFCACGDKKKTPAFLFRLARRHKAAGEIWLAFRLPGDDAHFEYVGHPPASLPEGTFLPGKVATNKSVGLSFECVEPMKKWFVKYDGAKMRKVYPNGDSEEVDVKMDLVWEATHPMFSIDRDGSAWTMARAVGREKFTKQFFEELRGLHQSHFEQMGKWSGSVTVNGKKHNVPLVYGMRDHTVGVREWHYIIRYISHYFFLEDGRAINYALASLPSMTHVECGYLLMPFEGGSGEKYAIQSVEPHMSEYGESGLPPKELEVYLVANNVKYHVKIIADDEFKFVMGNNSFTTFERTAKFIVDGKVIGWGYSEFGYRHE